MATDKVIMDTVTSNLSKNVIIYLHSIDGGGYVTYLTVSISIVCLDISVITVRVGLVVIL